MIMTNRYLSKRSYMTKLFYKLPVVIARTIARTLIRTDIILPYYHMISNEEVLHVKHLYPFKSIKEFRQDMDFLLQNYSPVNLRDFLSMIKNGRPLPKNAFLLTFDDGFREISDIVAPILLEKGISATFFINSAFTDNRRLCYLNKASLLAEQYIKKSSLNLENKLSEILLNAGISFEEIKSGILSVDYPRRRLLDEMAQLLEVDFNSYLAEKEPYLTSSQINALIKSGFTIGAHSVDHPLYASISLEEQLHQTLESLRFIRERFHLGYGVFAFPHSDHNVSQKFFNELYKSSLIDVSFGTAGLMYDSIPLNFQRVSLEKPVVAAEKIVVYQHAVKIIKLLIGEATIQRY